MINDRTTIDADDVVQHQCAVCRHFRKGKTLTCDAFPEGIPSDVVDNSFDHRTPHAGDGGIHFEPRAGEQYPINLRGAVELAAAPSMSVRTGKFAHLRARLKVRAQLINGVGAAGSRLEAARESKVAPLSTPSLNSGGWSRSGGSCLECQRFRAG